MPGRTDPDEVAGGVPLTGGVITSVVRVGDTVRRATGPWSPAVHALLGHLQAVGFSGAPRFLSTDDAGREILSYIDGDVPSGADPSVVTDAALHDVGCLIRELHAATASFNIPKGVNWDHKSMGGPPPHVVCHHDLSPRNTVFQDGRAVAFIDWDLAGPAAPIHDLVHAAWQFVPLAHPASTRHLGWSEPPDHARRLRVLLDAYGLSSAQRARFAARTAARVEVTASGIETLAAAGRPPFVRLVEQGIVQQIRADRDWVLQNADSLDQSIRAALG